VTSNLPVADNPDDLGPAMAALLPRQRAFVEQLFINRQGRGRLSASAAAAGYGVNSTPHALAVIASRLVQMPAIVAAIREYTMRVASSLAPEAIDVLKDIMRDPSHKDRARIASQFVERAAPIVQQIQVTHEDVTPQSREKDMVAYLRRLLSLGVPREGLEKEFGYSGLPRYERLLKLEDASKPGAAKQQIEEGSFTEVVVPSADGLEDVI
jgi:phage terminase small subunit